MFGLLSTLIITVSVLILLPKDKETKILLSPTIYSIYHSDLAESFKVEIMTNNPNEYYFEIDYILSSNFSYEDEVMSVNIKEINRSNDPYYYNEEAYYLVEFILTLPFESNNLKVEYLKTNFNIHYDNNEEISLYIGEFNYVFSNNESNDIGLNNLSATYEIVDSTKTIGGINLDLANLSDAKSIMTNIELLTPSVTINDDKIMKRDECLYTKKVLECLQINMYYFHDSSNRPLTLLLGKNNHANLYLPLVYEGDIHFLYKTGIKVDYLINDDPFYYIIDDFMFMNTTIFSESHQDNYVIVTLSD